MYRGRRHLHVIVWLAAAWLSGCDETGPGAAPGFLFSFGRTGMGPGEFSYPRAAVLSPDGRLCVVDKSARVQCFDLSGKFLLEWHMPEWSAGKPAGLGLGPDGRVYVADTHYSRVVVYDGNGQLLAQFGSRGEGPGQFIMPTDIVVDRAGCLYVSEYGGNDRISKFSPDYEYQFSFGGLGSGDAELQRPQSLLLADDGTLWVADACNHRVCHFAADGRFFGQFGHSGSGPGEMRFPYGLDRLSDGTFVVAEYGNNRVQRFNVAGQSLGVWGVPGRRPGELAYLWAVVVAPGDRLYVIDSGNNRVQVVDAHDAHIWQQP